MNRLRELREKAGLRQTDVAEATGIDQKTLSNYETGKTYPHSYALISLAEYFHVSIDYIVGRIDTEQVTADRQEISQKLDIIYRELESIKKLL